LNKELIIQASPSGVELALLENKKLVELHTETNENEFAVGDLYLGKLKKTVPGNNAAFINVGFEKDGFLHYTDLSPYFKSLQKFTAQSVAGINTNGLTNFELENEILKGGKISEVFSNKQDVLVQILKEPISAKGPRLSCEISLPGRFVVLTPFNNIIAVSRKIHNAEERKRLQKIIEAIRPKNFGVIVRTAAEGCNTAELHEDLNDLTNTWNTIQQNLKAAKAPQKILSEQTKTTSILRDLLNDSFNSIVTNHPAIYRDTLEYIQKIAPEKSNIVNYHKNGTSVFEHYGVNRQVKGSFGKTINLPSGAYVIIEKTEALHVIDVNSGYKSISDNQEQNAMETNLEAAAEIARQLRLRDLGGIIVVDFIDLKLPENKRLLHQAMEEAMRGDRARHSALPISKFGLMQITRQRMRPEVVVETEEICPSCEGTGKIGSAIALEDELFNKLRYLASHGHQKVQAHVHPVYYGYLTKGLISKRRKWSWELKQNIQLQADPLLHLTQYKFFDDKQQEIRM
jgi:ribonuclease G